MTAPSCDGLHHPGSQGISLKLFSIVNVGRAASGIKSISIASEDRLMVQDSLSSLGDMVEVTAALTNLCLAAHLVAPWNLSFVMIDTFLRTRTNMEQVLNGYRKTAIVAVFVDHALQVNATNWLQDEDFLDIPSLQALWVPERQYGRRKP
jgi:hypothetical protein